MADLVEVDAEGLEDAGGDALALADEAEQQVLRADVVVAEAARLVDGQLDDALRARRQADLADDRAVAAADDELDGGPDLGQLDVHVLEDARGDTLALADEAQEQVLRADVVVVEPLRLVLSERQDLARAIRELVEAIHRVERLFPFRPSHGATHAPMLARRRPASAGPSVRVRPAWTSPVTVAMRMTGQDDREGIETTRRSRRVVRGLGAAARRPSSVVLGRSRRPRRLGLGLAASSTMARRRPRGLGSGSASSRRSALGLGLGSGASRRRPLDLGDLGARRRLSASGLGARPRPRRRSRRRLGLGGVARRLGRPRRRLGAPPAARPRRLRRPAASASASRLDGRPRRRPRLGGRLDLVGGRPRRRRRLVSRRGRHRRRLGDGGERSRLPRLVASAATAGRRPSASASCWRTWANADASVLSIPPSGSWTASTSSSRAPARTALGAAPARRARRAPARRRAAGGSSACLRLRPRRCRSESSEMILSLSAGPRGRRRPDGRRAGATAR